MYSTQWLFEQKLDDRRTGPSSENKNTDVLYNYRPTTSLIIMLQIIHNRHFIKRVCIYIFFFYACIIRLISSLAIKKTINCSAWRIQIGDKTIYQNHMIRYWNPLKIVRKKFWGGEKPSGLDAAMPLFAPPSFRGPSDSNFCVSRNLAPKNVSTFLRNPLLYHCVRMVSIPGAVYLGHPLPLLLL